MSDVIGQCSSCRLDVTRNQRADYLGDHIRHGNRSDCVRPLLAEIENLNGELGELESVLRRHGFRRHGPTLLADVQRVLATLEAERQRARLPARVRDLLQAIINNDPDDIAADGGITALDVWRKDCADILDAIEKDQQP